MSCQPRWCVRAIRFVAVSAIVLLPVALMLLLGLAWNRACAQAQPGTGGKGDYYPLRPGARWDYRVKVGDEVQGAISEVVAAIETVNNVPLVRLETQVKGKTVKLRAFASYQGWGLSPPDRRNRDEGSSTGAALSGKSQ
jgi:hypothetical protein